MNRILKASLASLLAATGLSAAQFQIDLSSANTTASTPVTALVTGQSPFAQKTYSSQLYSSAILGAPLISSGQTFMATDPTGKTVKLTAAGAPLMGSGGIFGDIPESTTLTVGVGKFGVATAWTMLNDEYGTDGSSFTTVTFNFGASANATAYDYSVVFRLVDGQQIRGSLLCNQTTSNSAYGASAGTCPNYATTLSNGSAVASNYNVRVAATQVASTTYTDPNDTSRATARDYPFLKTSGSAVLDLQRFDFNYTALANDYLVNVKITNTGGQYNPFDVAPVVDTSRTALSALTVEDGATTPEPGTVALFLSGLGLVAAAKRRQRRA